MTYNDEYTWNPGLIQNLPTKQEQETLLKSIKIGESVRISPELTLTRVPNGWICYPYCNDIIRTVTFVPENQK